MLSATYDIWTKVLGHTASYLNSGVSFSHTADTAVQNQAKNGCSKELTEFNKFMISLPSLIFQEG